MLIRTLEQEIKDTTRTNEIKYKQDKSDDTNTIEETITGPAAIRFYNLLKNPPKDPERDKIIKEALCLFPEPNKPIKIDIEL